MTLGKGVDDMVGPDVQVSERIQQAMDMAKAFHEGQMRRGNGGMKPYYDEHILGVYNILREECGITDEDILITALLHDTVEDTECTLDDIESAFGADIREQVRLLTRIQGEPFSVYARRLFSQGSYQTVIVKLADRLHNLRTINYMTEEKIKEETKATIRCIPFETFLDDDKEPGTCMVTGKPSACRALFARSY